MLPFRQKFIYKEKARKKNLLTWLERGMLNNRYFDIGRYHIKSQNKIVQFPKYMKNKLYCTKGCHGWLMENNISVSRLIGTVPGHQCEQSRQYAFIIIIIVNVFIYWAR